MKTRHIYTELATPCTLTSVSESLSHLPLRSLKASQVKIADCISSACQTPTASLDQTMLNLSHSTLNRSHADLTLNRSHANLTLTHRKPSKISILPLTREKVRVTHKSRRRVEASNGSSGCAVESGKAVESGGKACKGVESAGKAYVQFFTMLSFMNNKLKRRCFKLEVLIEDLIVYFQERGEGEWSREVGSVVKVGGVIKRHVVEEGGELRYEWVKQCEGELAKLFFNICYEIYLYKHNQQTLPLLSLIHRDIEYYSRRLGLLNLATLSCMDMGRLCSVWSELERAAHEYSKAVKLAVFTGDKYSEEVAIDRLGMCEYYRGDLVAAHYFHSSTDKLSAYDKWKIHKYYSNENEIQKILEEKTKEKTLEESVNEEFFRHKENHEFNFDGMTKDSEFVQNNYDAFRNNLKEMIKLNSLRSQVPTVKRALLRAERVGDRIYRGHEYCLPRASKYYTRESGKAREECLVSHRSFNRSSLAYDTARIDRHCRIIDQILNFFTTEQKSQIRSIKEVRESCLSEENNS